MSTSLTEFHKLEYESLRKEIESSVKEARQLEKYALVVAAAVWTWLAKDGSNVAHPSFYWIPAIFVLFGIVRSIALLLVIKKIAKYLETVERVFASNPPMGWETFVTNPRDYTIALSSAFFWLALLLVTCIAPLLLLT